MRYDRDKQQGFKNSLQFASIQYCYCHELDKGGVQPNKMVYVIWVGNVDAPASRVMGADVILTWA